ncbi:MAG: FecR domain-containing protein, partial [Pseudobdellovibrio sp.]
HTVLLLSLSPFDSEFQALLIDREGPGVSDSRAKVVMWDRNILNILPNSKLKIVKLSNSEADKNVHMNLIEGRVRAEVGDHYDNKSSKFEIKTATAVAGVRGTRFITSYEPTAKVTEVVTLSGVVTLKRLAVAQEGNKELPEVLVGRQEKSQVKEGSDPSDPVKVPKKEFDALNHDTEVKTDKDKDQSKNNSGKGGSKTAAPADTTTPDAGTGGAVGTAPIATPGSGITTTPIVQPPPSTTKVNIKIK